MNQLCRNAPRCGHPICIHILQLINQQNAFAETAAESASDYVRHYLTKTLKHNSILTGHRWMIELVEGNEHRFREQMRMTKSSFFNLISFLQENCAFEPYGTFHMMESVGIAIKFLSTGCSYSEVCERFQHSPETIHRHFKVVLKAFNLMSDILIQPLPDTFDGVPEKIATNPRYFPYFMDCVGALDGTHVNVHLPRGRSSVYWVDRHGQHSTNILAVCDFNMYFTYADVGKEGSMHDSNVLRLCLNSTTPPFPVPPNGRYYLGDSGFGLRRFILTPYRGVRYHLPEFHDVGRTRNRDEYFNYIHSSLRSVIERSFGVLKRRWQILYSMMGTDIDTQMEIIRACFGLHNFLRRYSIDDDDEVIAENNWTNHSEPITDDVGQSEEQMSTEISRSELREMLAFRDAIRDALQPMH